ncbi:Cysteine/O-acetylserine efflux protein [bacterium YEK0313]|nr:Cysteine/O-acetylserine efflux protein [bacterium YEK0313]
MAPDTLLPLVIFVAVSTVSPGGATTLATASGAHFGFRRSVPLLAGIATGLASLAAAAAAGLGAVVLAVPPLRLAMQLAGTAYLLWLAWRLAASGPPQIDGGIARPRSFAGGALLVWYNPKAWAVTLGAAGSFSGLADDPLALGAILGLVFGLSAIAALSLWCAAGLALARLMATERQWRVANGLLATLLVLSIVPMWL